MTQDAPFAPGIGPWEAGLRPHTPFPADAVRRSVAARFWDVAEARADHLALSSPAGRWTYGELLTTARERAGGLVDAAGRRPVPVAVLATHDGPLVTTILSVLLAGHIVVVLDPAAPVPQHTHILDECGPPVLLHDAAHADLAAEIAATASIAPTTLDLGTVTGTPVGRPSGGPDDAVMLAFTSGTSGTSKGGIITNGVLMNLVRGASDRLGIDENDRMPMLFPTSLAVAAYPMFLPLLNGGTLSTLDVRSVGLAPIADFLADERITLAYLAPTVVRFLVDALAGRTFPDLRMVALGGELVDAEVVGLTRDLLGPDLLANGYGTTETGVIALHVIDPADPPEGAVPAGRPVPDVELHVLDDAGAALAQGETGEIAVASPYLFAGYWGHPELNRQVLTDDPGRRPGWRLYRTGDFGHLDEHGALVVSGRIDTRVKVRGRFVVLGDVEARLHELTSVSDAAVVARDRNGVTELVAYVVPAVDGVGGADLRSELLTTEEPYRVPSRWVLLDELPRLPNGKTDRRALPAPEVVEGASLPTATPAAGSAGQLADHQPVREALRGIWEHLLPVGSVSVDEDFFHLGGDSLLAAQMIMEVEHRLGVTVPMGELVAARTIRSLAEVVARLDAAAAGPVSTAACVQAGDESTRPRLWFVHDLQGSAFRVRHLAHELGDDQPVWSFESPLLRGEPNRFRSLDTFVARYLTDLRAAQPEGPYWLAGYSFGGICAYEMARQLRRDGQDVAFVGIVDVGPQYRGPGWHGHRSPLRPWFGVVKPPPAGTSVVGRLRHYRDMVRTSRSGAARHLMIRSGLFRLVDPFRFRNDLRRHGRVRPEWRLWYAWEEHWRLAATAWDRASTYPGEIDLFWADASASGDSTMGWAPLVAEVRVHRFGGDHEGILEPRGAASLAAVLRPAMDDVLRDDA